MGAVLSDAYLSSLYFFFPWISQKRLWSTGLESNRCVTTSSRSQMTRHGHPSRAFSADERVQLQDLPSVVEIAMTRSPDQRWKYALASSIISP
jgi:hypothetical protein